MWPFAEGVRAGVGANMTSYNEVGQAGMDIRAPSLILF